MVCLVICRIQGKIGVFLFDCIVNGKPCIYFPLVFDNILPDNGACFLHTLDGDVTDETVSFIHELLVVNKIGVIPGLLVDCNQHSCKLQSF